MKTLMLFACSAVAIAQEAHARSCNDSSTMAGIIGVNGGLLEARWEPTSGFANALGMKHLFTNATFTKGDEPGSQYACESCHSGGANAQTTVFTACSSCHTRRTGNTTAGSAGASDPIPMTAPDWLDFTSVAKLRRGSYYLPGRDKANASLLRTHDGTMPPGAQPKDQGDGAVVSWCDEIQTKVEAWITAGYP